MHYLRLYRYGSTDTPPKSRPFGVRFWSKVETTDNPEDCWPWKGALRGLYGQVKHQGVRLGAHRVAYTLSTGEIPEGMTILHRCDNPPCCNPAHLSVGTQGDNNRDKTAKNRYATQYRNRRVDHDEVRRRYANGEKQREVASSLGINQSSVSKIVGHQGETK